MWTLNWATNVFILDIKMYKLTWPHTNEIESKTWGTLVSYMNDCYQKLSKNKKKISEGLSMIN